MTADPSLDTPRFFDLSTRVKLRVTGADSVRYLNGQITNDLRRARASSAIQASILNAKGKLSAHVFVTMDDDGTFLLDADPDLREELPARLERYIIADDVQIEDVSERFSILHFLAEPPASRSLQARVVSAERFGMPGWDYWCDPVSLEDLAARYSDQFSFCDDICAETLRIERGVPRWGRELTSDIIPVEANLEASSIDYAKGCYIGQEVISRMKMSGQTNKRLCGLVSLSGAPLVPDARLTREEASDKEVGWITSATRSPRLEREIGLGYVKRGSNEPDTRLLAAEVPVQVIPLPFV